VVIVFSEITDQHLSSEALAAARYDAASAANSRLLASANYDLRQPLQTLALLHGLLEKTVQGTRQLELVARVNDMVVAMTEILNPLLDINQIEAGIAAVDQRDFPINGCLERVQDEFAYTAAASKVSLETVTSSAIVHSDPLRLEQMIRNLCSNAIKHSPGGRVLIGCRRRGSTLDIEVWDTGGGLDGEHLTAIFQDYYQVPDAANRGGLGLGLSVVRRLGGLLQHPLTVRSVPGRGSVFVISVPMVGDTRSQVGGPETATSVDAPNRHRSASILLVEGDPEVLRMLEMLVRDDGHRTATAPDGVAALELIRSGAFVPDLVVADLSLPIGPSGMGLATLVRDELALGIPAIILTGDISAETLRGIAQAGYVRLRKPAFAKELSQTIQDQLAQVEALAAPLVVDRPLQDDGAVIYIVDDSPQHRDVLEMMARSNGHTVVTFATGEAFLAFERREGTSCLVVNASLSGMSGLQLLVHARDLGLPAIMITESSDVATAVVAMRAGATDFIETPINRIDLMTSIDRALTLSRRDEPRRDERTIAIRHLKSLTDRQRQIMDLVLAGHPSKNIAADLGISQRTVENHRAAIMKRTGTKSLPALLRLVLSVEGHDARRGEPTGDGREPE
jgi:two-component system CheB/CheR fusion protein